MALATCLSSKFSRLFYRQNFADFFNFRKILQSVRKTQKVKKCTKEPRGKKESILGPKRTSAHRAL
jgi:hypothetical protein